MPDQDFVIEVKDWVQGVVTSMAGDLVPNNAVTEAWNTMITEVGGDQGVIRTRPGIRFVKTLVPTFSRPFVHIQAYNYDAADGAFEQCWALVDDQGTVFTISKDYTWNGLSLASLSESSGKVPSVDGTVMNNRLFMVASGKRVSLRPSVPASLPNPQTLTIFGMDKPGFAAEAIAGGSMLPAGTYDVAVTQSATVIGNETSLTDPQELTVTSGQRIRVTITPAASNEAVNTWAIYVRARSTQAVLYKVVNPKDSSGNPIGADGDIPTSTTTAYVDISATELLDNIIIGPDTTENDPPPASALYVATFGRRLIVADTKKVYWSKVDKPDQFPIDNFEIVESGEGDEIRGIYPFSTELLIVFTKTSVFGIFGNDPQYWVLRPIDLTVGLENHKSLVEFDKSLAWWSSQRGPVVFDGESAQPIGIEFLGRDRIDSITPEMRKKIIAGVDPSLDTILWGVADVGDVENTLLLPFNYRLKRWVASRWDPGIVSAMGTGYDKDDVNRCFFGMQATASLFHFDLNAPYDGYGSSTLPTTNVVVAGSTPVTTISGTFAGASTAGFNAHIVETATGMHVATRRVTSATGIAITLDREVNWTVGTSYTVYTQGINVQIKTKWFNADLPFFRKRWDRLYAHIRMWDPTKAITFNFQKNYDTTGTMLTKMVTGSAETATTDVTWDLPVYTQEGFKLKRMGVWKNANVLRIIISQAAPYPFILSKLTLMGRVLSDRYYD